MEKKRSKGLIAYGVSLLVFSLFICLMVFIGLLTSAPSSSWLLVFLLPFGLLISSIGLLMLWNWARYLFIVSASVIALILFVMFVFDIARTIKSTVAVIIIFGSIYFLISAIRYFTRLKVKEQFKK